MFYAVQATGNGHISRANVLYPYFREYGEVDFLLSGSNSTLNTDFPIKFRSKGLSLAYAECGGLHYGKTIRKANLVSAMRDAHSLPLEKYDLIINDFDFITSYACRTKRLKSIQFGHQASFQSYNTPRPSQKSLVGEMILKYYATASDYVGLHFRPYDEFIYTPIIKQEIVNAKPADHGHITVYLPSFEPCKIKKLLRSLSPVEVHWFLPNTEVVIKKGNITYFPVNGEFFNESLIFCHGIITGGGFETPSEALYLNKKLLSVPIVSHYEQRCNAAALALLGVKTLVTLNDTMKTEVFNWVKTPSRSIAMPANDVGETLKYMFSRSR